MSEEEIIKTLAEYLDNKNLDIPNEFYNAIVFLRDKYFKLEKALRTKIKELEKITNAESIERVEEDINLLKSILKE